MAPRLLLAILLAGSLFLASGAAASGSTVEAAAAADVVSVDVAARSEEARFLAMANDERVSHGLAPLTVYHDLVDDAGEHTARMMAAGDLFHSKDLGRVTTDWLLLGENVGYGPTVEALHAAFMASPSHRRNVLGDFDRVGIAADRSPGGRLYVTFVFMKSAPAPIPVSSPLSPEEAALADSKRTSVAPASSPAAVPTFRGAGAA